MSASSSSNDASARSPGHAQLPARLLIAGIGGLVIGLFGNFGEGHTQTGELPFNLEVWSLAG